MDLIRKFENLSKNDVSIAGGKGASLGEMTKAGIPVPPGFVVLAGAFQEFIKETDLNIEIDSILHTVETDKMHTVEDASAKIQKLILDAKMPEELASDILRHFNELGAEFVAVRSSATAEDSATAAWAGQLDSFLNTTKDTLLQNVQKCWASLFTPRAIFYRFEKNLHGSNISVAVVVQKMVESEESGIAFSVHPVTEDRNQMIIEGGLGLGEAIVSGQITPDSYVVEKTPRRIVDKNINVQGRGIFRAVGGPPPHKALAWEPNEWRDIPKEKGEKEVLSDNQVLELAELILKIENHYGFPVDIEWAREGGKFYIVQSRPITTLETTEILGDTGTKHRRRGVEVNGRFILGNQDVDTSFYTLEMTWRKMRDERIREQVGMLTPPMFAEIIEGKTINVYADAEGIKKFVGVCSRAVLPDKKLLDMFKEKTIETTEAIREIAAKHYRKTERLSNDEKATLLDEMAERQAECVLYGNVVAWSDVFGGITNKTLEIIKRRSNLKYPLHVYSAVLGAPTEKSLTEKAYEDIRRGDDSDEKLMGRYFWLDQGYIGRGLTKEEIEEIRSSKNETKETTPLADELLRELKLTKDEAQVFEVLRDIIFIKSLRADSRQFIHVVANQILDKLASEKDIKAEYLEALSAPEISSLLRGGKNPQELELRFRHSLLFPENRLYRIVVNEGEIKESLKKLLLKERFEQTNELKGQPAQPGRAKGRARLVFSAQHNHKVHEGDILISTATSPQLLPAMKRAAAFVTDVGGVTSHAAIVARELKKPCVVGTKYATQIISDGDLVEVDADKGVVRILEKANLKE